MQKNYSWWKNGTIYQVYPRSFLDSNGDGVGDLQGIISKLDYIKELGVDAVWFNPFYESPMADFGYDISDFYNVDHIFGNNTDILHLIKECHQRGLKVILDMVFNHTSSEHAWFQESRSSLDNPKRDWYIWQKEIPNNWQSLFGGPAWTQCEFTGEYYYHFFLSEQPDLNLRHPEVQAEIKKILKHYLEIGVDGFRLDAVNTYFEDTRFRDNPDTEFCENEYSIECQQRKYNFDHHETYNFLDDLENLVGSYPDRMIVGEVAKDGADQHAWKSYYGSCNQRLDLVFNFDLFGPVLNKNEFYQTLVTWENLEMCSWPTYALSSHDQIRPVTRLGVDGDTPEMISQKSKLMTMYLLTVRGTPFIYYGQEIDMEEYQDISNEEVQDPWAIRTNFRVPTRDGCRTPMLWNAHKNAGFSEVKPWLPISKNYQSINVETQKSNPNSTLNFYKELIKLRKENPALNNGELEILSQKEDDLIIFNRRSDDQEFQIILNFTDQEVELEINPEDVILTNSPITKNQIPAYCGVIKKLTK